MKGVNIMLDVSYEQFREKNEENKNNFKRAVKSGQLNPKLSNVNPYMSFSIESVSLKYVDSVAEIRSNTRSCYTKDSVSNLVDYVMNSNTIHMSNPSRIKSWRGFME